MLSDIAPRPFFATLLQSAASSTSTISHMHSYIKLPRAYIVLLQPFYVFRGRSVLQTAHTFFFRTKSVLLIDRWLLIQVVENFQ